MTFKHKYGIILYRKGGERVELQAVLDTIGTVGFPIAVCLILMWYIFKTTESHKAEVKNLTTTYEKQVQELIDKHQQECTELSNALNNNTIVMKQILERMRKE